ncbi:MAG: MlaD family protein [Polyangiales bacterium]
MGPNSRSTEIKVGIFVFAALMIAGIVAFAVGNKQNVFSRKVDFQSVFDTVGGLRPGSPVSMAGVDVGTVTSVELKDDGKIHVRFGLIADAAKHVRVDSLATIGNKGLLGDKLIDIVPGQGAAIPPGGTIPSESPVDLGQYMTKASKILIDAEATISNLRSATEPFADPEFGDDVKATAKNLATLSEMVSRKGGLVDRLNRPETAAHVEATLANADAMSKELVATAASLRAIGNEVANGDGTAHELIYGDSGKKLVRELANASEELTLMMKSVRTGDGTAHDILYGHRGSEILDNLAEVSADLKAISSDVRAGKGTIGALLVDPSIYEDVKRLVGNLERNEILRAFVRYSIRQDDSRPSPSVAPASN